MRLIQPFWTNEETQSGKAERMRANDGAVDSKGRFWASAVCDPLVTSFTPDGERDLNPQWRKRANNKLLPTAAVLFRLDTDGQFHRVITGATIPNGLSWSMDNKTMYWTDTDRGAIYAYDFDESGNISNKRVFFQPKDGGPDGHAQDEHGNLWVALWGAWKVVRVSPDGEVTAEVRVPTRCPTVSRSPYKLDPVSYLKQAVAFAGEDIYITSESEQEPEKYPESLKYHGDVFKCHVGVKGRPMHVARISVD